MYKIYKTRKLLYIEIIIIYRITNKNNFFVHSLSLFNIKFESISIVSCILAFFFEGKELCLMIVLIFPSIICVFGIIDSTKSLLKNAELIFIISLFFALYTSNKEGAILYGNSN